MTDIDRTPGEVAARVYLAKRKTPNPWKFICLAALALLATVAVAFASAAVGGKAIEKAAFYQVNSERGW